MIYLKNVTKLYLAKAADRGSGAKEVKPHPCAGSHLSACRKRRVALDHGTVGFGQIYSGESDRLPDRPTAGEIWLDGQDVATISAADLTRVRAEKNRVHLSTVPS